MPLVLTSHKICPFGQRLWLALESSGLPYTFSEVEIAPGKKSATFTSLYKSALGADASSDGKVPILEHPEAAGGPLTLTESLHCADYVCALAPAARLLPELPHERARTGLFLEGVGKYTGPFYALLMKQTAEEQEAARKALIDACAALSAHLAHLGGPFLLGPRATFGDLMLWPFVERLCILHHYRGFDLDAVAAAAPALAPLVAWRTAMLALPAVKATTMPPEFFIEGYAAYARGGPGK